MSGELTQPKRLMNFVSEQQLDTSKKIRGARIEDGTAQCDRPLFEILRENKDKHDAEFNERFKHQPPKALDEDETEFLEKIEMSRREYEQQLAAEEARQLHSFQAAVAAQATTIHKLKERPNVSDVREEKRSVVRRKEGPSLGASMVVRVMPQPKKAKTDLPKSHESHPPRITLSNTCKSSLVSYSDESEDEDE